MWKEKNYGIYLDGKSDMKLTADGDRLTTRLLGFIEAAGQENPASTQ